MPHTHYTRRTKIIATLSPACTDLAIIRALFEAGVDMFRLDAGDGAEENGRSCALLRELARGAGYPIPILLELQGASPASLRRSDDATPAGPPLSAADRRALALALEAGVEWIGLAAAHRPDEVKATRGAAGRRVGLMTRIGEVPAPLPVLRQMIAASDGILAPLNLLNAALPREDGPNQPAGIMRLCREFGRPVIAGIAMRGSMGRGGWPGRTEAAEVATAILNGVDAVMLSAEAFSGQRAVEAVAMTDRTIRAVENETLRRPDPGTALPDPCDAEAIVTAARSIVATLLAEPEVTWPWPDGAAALRGRAPRPGPVPILGLTAIGRRPGP
ncbi:MAG TPA: pyruvate kinase [Crenalkalicoccus sp.]|nr:pyruvate kinase [Crenalkalicoccus sp.]